VWDIQQCDLSRKQLQFAGAHSLGVRIFASANSPPSLGKPRGHEISTTQTEIIVFVYSTHIYFTNTNYTFKLLIMKYSYKMKDI
jgi:hypothetical protein